MHIIKRMEKIIKKDKKTIILPEASDNRILKATENILKKDLCNIILIGEEKSILNSKYNLKGAKIFDPFKDIELKDKLISNFLELRKDKGITLEEAQELFENNYTYYACMMVKLGLADGVVSGAIHTSSDTIRPALQIIKNKSDYKFVSSFFLMEFDKRINDIECLLYADCGLVQYPSDLELAEIAMQSSKSYDSLLNDTPKVAMLSHSTYGSAKSIVVDRINSAINIVRNKNKDIIIDGELQFDAALFESIRKIKAPNSVINGYANVLIFPDIDSGNIAYKITERLAGAHAYGPIMQGLNNPVNDLSRASTVKDIEGVIVITALQAIKNI